MSSPNRTILLQTHELRALEAAHRDLPLMDRAGAAAARVALDIIGRPRRGAHAPVLVIAGPGNNGGDGFVLARHLRAARQPVVVVLAGDAARLPADAANALKALHAAGVATLDDAPPGNYALVVDALFGIGARPLDGPYAAWVERINAFAAAGGPVLALDVPSGLDADTGAVLGTAVRATHTATFIAAKPGLYTAGGPDHAGTVSVHDLGLAAPKGAGAVLSDADYANCLHPRAADSHKGSYGSLGVIGGAAGMTGAALLAARAGLHLGAGRVFCGLLAPQAVDAAQPELMLRTPAGALAHATALVVGPGLGDAPEALVVLRRIATTVVSNDAPTHAVPTLLDADALNALSAHPVLAAQFARRVPADTPLVLTPHPAEAARLLGVSTAAIQADRVAAALRLATRFAAVVALKGCGTVVADVSGRWRINTSGGPALASGGSGDVLAGMIGALLAQGWPAWQAACGGVHWHGLAADDLVAAGIGAVGLTASELLAPARARFNTALRHRATAAQTFDQ